MKPTQRRAQRLEDEARQAALDTLRERLGAKIIEAVRPIVTETLERLEALEPMLADAARIADAGEGTVRDGLLQSLVTELVVCRLVAAKDEPATLVRAYGWLGRTLQSIRQQAEALGAGVPKPPPGPRIVRG